MTKVLYIEASPRKGDSYSSQVAAEFLDAYQEANPDHEIERMPLFDMELPHFAAEGAIKKWPTLRTGWAAVMASR